MGFRRSRAFRFPPEVILLPVRWYLQYGLSHRDLEELLPERGIEAGRVTLFRWVQRFTPLLIEAARPCRHAIGDRWFVDETHARVAGVWRYAYRAVDQHGQVENNRCEADHGRLKARLRPTRGLKTNRTASVVIRGHAFHSEPWSRRTRDRHDAPGTAGRGIRRTRPGELTGQPGSRMPVDRLTQQCR